MAKAIHMMIRVLDEKRSVEFYRQALGLGIADRFQFDSFTLVYLRSPEADITPVWAEALARARPEDTVLTPAFSGRMARALRNAYTDAAMAPGAPEPAPYPVQRHLSEPMRQAAIEAQDFDRLYALAGQAAGLARAEPAGAIARRLWDEARALLG